MLLSIIIFVVSHPFFVVVFPPDWRRQRPRQPRQTGDLKIQNDALLKQSNVEKKDVGVNTDVEESADEVHLEHSLVEEDNQRGDESLLEGQGESSVLSTDFPKLLRMKSVQERAINALRRWCRVILILIY